MENNLPNLIAHYQEKFDEKFGYYLLPGDKNPDPAISSKAKAFLASTLKEVITQAFLATKVEKKDIGNETLCMNCGEFHDLCKCSSFNAALAEGEARKADFLAGK